MKRSKIIACLLAGTLLVTSLTGCALGEGDLNSTLDEGASEFAYGKEETDYTPKSSDDILAEMLDEFSGSMEEPEIKEIPKDDIPKIIDDTDPDQIVGGGSDQDDEPGTEDDQGGGTSSTQQIVISNDDELKQLMHDMMDDSKEVATFALGDGYQLDPDTLQDLYSQLEFEDAYDVISVLTFSWVNNEDNSMLQLGYAFDISTLKQIKAESRNLAKAAAATIETSGKTEYEIVQEVNEYLCKLNEYPDQDNSLGTRDGYMYEDHTAYGALKNGRCVCDGYAKAAKAMLNELGIECGVEIGTCTNGGGHAWNLVEVEDDWYQMDVCWNDGCGDTDMYLCVTDAFMKESRTWEESWYPATPTKAYVDR